MGAYRSTCFYQPMADKIRVKMVSITLKCLPGQPFAVERGNTHSGAQDGAV